MSDLVKVRHPTLVLVTVLSATFVQLVDISIVNVAIPSIQKDLHSSFAAIQLVLAGYQLAFACALITGARLGDIHGRRRLFLIGMTGFTIASALCGAAQSPNQLIAFRVLQGLLSGLMFPQVLSVIQVVFPPQERGKAFGIFGATIGLATITGPLLGGSLIALNPFHTEWRSIFFVNVPIGVAAVIAAVRILPESKAPNADRLDIPGALLVASGLFLLVYPLSVGREKGWPPWSFACMVLAVPVLLLFAVYESRKTARRDSPLLLTTLFQDRSFTVGMLLSGVFFLGVAPFFFIFSITLQAGFGFTALGAGLTTFPFALGSAIAGARSDFFAKRIGVRLLRVGCGLLVIGHISLLLAFHFAGIGLHSYQLWLILLVCGVGLGSFVGPVSNFILAGVRREAAGSASGVISTAQLLAGAIGVAALGALFFGLLGANSSKAVAGPAREMRSALIASGASAGPADSTTLAFTYCFTKRAHAVDPSSPIALCPPGTTNPIIAKALVEARKSDFSRTIQQALIWEVVVFAIAFVVVGRLPEVAPEDAPPAAG